MIPIAGDAGRPIALGGSSRAGLPAQAAGHVSWAAGLVEQAGVSFVFPPTLMSFTSTQPTTRLTTWIGSGEGGSPTPTWPSPPAATTPAASTPYSWTGRSASSPTRFRKQPGEPWAPATAAKSWTKRVLTKFPKENRPCDQFKSRLSPASCSPPPRRPGLCPHSRSPAIPKMSSRTPVAPHSPPRRRSSTHRPTIIRVCRTFSTNRGTTSRCRPSGFPQAAGL